MKESCRDGCRTSLLIAGVVLVPAIFHTLRFRVNNFPASCFHAREALATTVVLNKN